MLPLIVASSTMFEKTAEYQRRPLRLQVRPLRRLSTVSTPTLFSWTVHEDSNWHRVDVRHRSVVVQCVNLGEAQVLSLYPRKIQGTFHVRLWKPFSVCWKSIEGTPFVLVKWNEMKLYDLLLTKYYQESNTCDSSMSIGLNVFRFSTGFDLFHSHTTRLSWKLMKMRVDSKVSWISLRSDFFTF